MNYDWTLIEQPRECCLCLHLEDVLHFFHHPPLAHNIAINLSNWWSLEDFHGRPTTDAQSLRAGLSPHSPQRWEQKLNCVQGLQESQWVLQHCHSLLPSLPFQARKAEEPLKPPWLNGHANGGIPGNISINPVHNIRKCKGKQVKINSNKTIKYIQRILFITAWSINSLFFCSNLFLYRISQTHQHTSFFLKIDFRLIRFCIS